jgi:hypothetical protein
MHPPAADITLGIVHEHQRVLGVYPQHARSTTECALAGDLQETEETRNIPPEESRRTKRVKETRLGNNPHLTHQVDRVLGNYTEYSGATLGKYWLGAEG